MSADDDVEVTSELVQYTDDDEVAYVDDGVVTVPIKPIIFDVDSKFVGSSWLDFYETYVLLGIADAIDDDTPIVEIDHSLDDRVVLTDSNAGLHEADHVIVTVPLRILQLGAARPARSRHRGDRRRERESGQRGWVESWRRRSRRTHRHRRRPSRRGGLVPR